MKLAHHRVLIVEDEIFIAMELEYAVRKAGGKVVGPALSLSEALRLLESQEITAAILDVRLGPQESLPVAQRLRAAGIPFIFHTGNHDPDKSSADWPDAPIVKKPALPETVVNMLASVAKI